MDSTSPARWQWLVVGALLVVGGQVLFTRDWGATWGLPIWLVGLVALVVVSKDVAPVSVHEVAVAEHASRDLSIWRGSRGCAVAVLAFVSGAAAASVWQIQRSRPIEEPRRDVVVLWLVSIVSAALVVWQPRVRSGPAVMAAVRHRWRRHQTDILTSVGLGLAAMGPMLFRVDSYPRAFNGDEAGFALISRRVMNGEIRNPFGLGYLSHPLMWNVVQARSMQIFGDNVAGARAPGRSPARPPCR